MKTTSRLAMAAGASLLATNVLAADLGGSCCADLEERVAELEATTARKGNRKVSLTVFGQVNKAILWHDSDQSDAYRSERFTVQDNDGPLMSRFGFRGSAKIRPDLEAGYVMVIGVQENLGTSSNPLSLNTNDQTRVNGLLIRENYLYLDSTQWGRVSLGQASQATDGLYEINLATAQVTPGGMDPAEPFLGQLFATTFLGPWDGSRRQGVYYRSPTLHGFILSAGWGHKTHDFYTSSTTDCSLGFCDADDFWEVALRYTAEFNGVRFAAGIGYRDEDNRDGNDNQIWLGSASIMHTPTGLFLSGGYGDRDSDSVSRQEQGFWVMAGVEKNWFGPGTTTVYGEYGQTDFDVNTSTRRDGNYWGLGAVQKFDAAAVDLYINYRNYELDSFCPDGCYRGDNANVVVSGAIIRF